MIRAERGIDPSLLRSTELGFLNGHVPVTGILSAIAVLAAVGLGRDAVVMSNEWSASFGNLVVADRDVNHQWSKGIEFEEGLRSILASTFAPTPDYFSLLRALQRAVGGRSASPPSPVTTAPFAAATGPSSSSDTGPRSTRGAVDATSAASST